MFTTHSYSTFCLIILRCKNDEINKKSLLLNVAAALKWKDVSHMHLVE